MAEVERVKIAERVHEDDLFALTRFEAGAFTGTLKDTGEKTSGVAVRLFLQGQFAEDARFRLIVTGTSESMRDLGEALIEVADDNENIVREAFEKAAADKK